MTENTYAKRNIIELVKKHGKLEYDFDHTTLEKRLQDIIEFLHEERIQYLLGCYFYKNEMNITKAKGGAFKEYNYNIIDAIFLAVLLSLYDQSLFKKLRNQSKIMNPKQEEEKWIKAFINKLSLFQIVWNEKSNQKSWEFISVNLESLFYRFTLLPKMSDHAKELQIKLYTLVKFFEELPDHHKVAFYDQAMKNRIPTILRKLKEYIQALKETNPAEYYDYKIHKNLVEIDRELESENDLEKYLKELKEFYYDKTKESDYDKAKESQ